MIAGLSPGVTFRPEDRAPGGSRIAWREEDPSRDLLQSMSAVLERDGLALGVFYQVERPVYGGKVAVPPLQPSSGTPRRGLDAMLAGWRERHGQAVAQHEEAPMEGSRYEHFPHGADIGVRGFGKTKEDAFVQAALAMTAVVADPSTIEPREAVDVTCEAPDDELLLADWLNALVYEMAVRRWLFCRFEVRLEGTRLVARAWGEPVDVVRHEPAVEVKGATYTELRVRQEPDGTWVAQCVVDV